MVFKTRRNKKKGRKTKRKYQKPRVVGEGRLAFVYYPSIKCTNKTELKGNAKKYVLKIIN